MRQTVLGNATLFTDSGDIQKETRLYIDVVWIDRDYYVQAYANMDESVLSYSVTTRAPRFRPALRHPSGGFAGERRYLRLLGLRRPRPFTLTKTRFGALSELPGRAESWVGFHNWHYYEAYWGGNPGLYQWFVFSINDAGAHFADRGFTWDEGMNSFARGFDDPATPIDPQLALEQSLRRVENQTQHEMSDEEIEEYVAELEHVPEAPGHWLRFRQQVRANTYTVLGPGMPLDDYPGLGGDLMVSLTVFGVTTNRVRTLG